MYSVEDLLISHGYKLPRSGPPSAASYDKRPADCQRELADNRAGRGTLNGYEADRGASISSGVYGSRPVLMKAYPGADNESGERSQKRKEAGSGNLGDAQPLGDSLATDSGFYDVPSLTYSEPLSHDERDVSYWRRRGQDFSVLLDYADGRELRASAGAWRPQALMAAEDHRAERQAQQLWEEISWLRDPDAAPGQLRVTGERKCQSLGTEEWKPAVGLGRQLSDGEGDRWAQEQHRLRTYEGSFHPRTKAKSQSLPRVLSPDGNGRKEVIPSRPSLPDRQSRMNSTVFSGPYSRYIYGGALGRDRWGRNAWPSSHVALLPKPRFSRPLKPPSYEIHQQTRGSAEMIAIDQGAKQKDRPIYYPRGGELQRQDYFAQHSAIFGMEPPGYIPPPSYKRAPPQRAVPINRNEMASFRWRGEPLQMPSSDAGRWFSRQAGSWLEHYMDRGVSYRKQVHSGYEEHPGQARYLPIEDPRVRQISGGPGENSLTDSDKIRNINKEIPCAKVLGQSIHDSAFPPTQGLALNADSRKTSLNENDSSSQWCNKGIKDKLSDSVAPEKSRRDFFPSSFLGRPPPPPCKPADQGPSETVTEVKKVEQPELPEKDKSKNLKKKLSETIFCLVSVPVTPQLSGTSRDQNNNDEKPPDPVGSPSDNKTGHLTNQSLQSTSSAEAELQALTGSIASSKTSSRASSKLVKKVPFRPPKINHYKELKLSGSWPANQYRDQETQTSPEARKPAPPGPENKEAQQDPVPQGPDVPPDGGGVVSTAFSFPIKGVKSLKLSSNSAFSLTATFSNHLTKSTAQPPAAALLSGNVDEAKPAASGGQETFGQFLLKPTSQRPWDAVKELEAINKELQDQQQQQSSKQPSVDKCIEDLNEAYKDILELGTASNKVPNGSVQIPERIKIRLTSEPLNKPSSLRRSAVSWSVDPDYREVKSAFSRPATKSVTFSKQLREELPVPPRETGFREYRVVTHLSRRRSSDGRTVKLDLPDEPIETPICDFSPTAMHTTAAEVPWADRQPMQDASTLTSPPDYEDICQTLLQPRDSTDVNKVSAGSSRPNDAEPPQGVGIESEEECPICKREMENQMRQGPLPPLHEENSSDSSANQNGSPPQCAGLDSPAEDMKAKEPSESNPSPEISEQQPLTEENVAGSGKKEDVQAEDLNDLSAKKPDESTPANESMEIGAAKILASDVPADSQVTGEQYICEPVNQEEELAQSKAITGDKPGGGTDKQTVEVKDKCEGQDSEASMSDNGQEQEKRPFAVPEHRLVLRTHLGRDHSGLPEFPPDRLPLSVPPNPDRRLSLSLEGERRVRVPSSRIEALQDKLSSPPSRVAVEHLARMKDVDTIYRMRRLSIRSTDSGEGDAEVEGEVNSELVEEPPPAPPRDKEDDPGDTESQKVSEETVLKDEEASSLTEVALQRLEIVFNGLKAHTLKLSPKKCHFLRQSVRFLGHMITEEGVLADPDKVMQLREKEKEARAVVKLLKQWDKLSVEDGALYRVSKDPLTKSKRYPFVVPPSLRQEVLRGCHVDAAHQGQFRSLHLVRQRGYWVDMERDVRDHMKSCAHCVIGKTPEPEGHALLESIKTSTPLELMCIDFWSAEDSTNKTVIVLVITDHLTKLAHAFQCPDQTARSVARKLWDEYFCIYGFPQHIHSDQGAVFESEVISHLMQISGVQKSHTTAYHPMGNGVTERFNRTMGNMTRALPPRSKQSWPQMLHTVTFIYNCTAHETTDFPPFYLMFGRVPRIPVDVDFGSVLRDRGDTSYPNYIEPLQEDLKEAMALANSYIAKEQNHQAESYNKRAKGSTIRIGDSVLIVNKGEHGRYSMEQLDGAKADPGNVSSEPDASLTGSGQDEAVSQEVLDDVDRTSLIAQALSGDVLADECTDSDDDDDGGCLTAQDGQQSSCSGRTQDQKVQDC
ncbi:junctional cadherin 5-associated protein [Lampris incognitus]|uniref:junctional cadherin 5-associated protein n=1 Tax=Lampris incognitus TaxID=2546036 RepID=UPI0024B4D978|nr:junctional cadherin 5-associated protein [Lampris incognitus]